MALRTILTVPHPVLKEISKPVEGGVTDEHRALMDDMLETMYDAPGVGLAAVQIGVPLRIIVMDISPKEDVREPRYYVNPEIIWKSEELKSWEEGCLSVPEIYDEVDRPARVKIRYLDYHGKEIEEDADGLFAVCIQHEMDHLEGVVFLDHLSRLKRDSAIRKVKKLQKFEAA
ncbi:MAG: peptide deformylase [Alphaproteobacteria bacterium]|mgnify:CR=1 FL=1|nr:peptide deformylase [Alphaproteobacteria bacterium]